MNSETQIDEKFTSYYEGWIKQLELHLQQLVMGLQKDYEKIVATLTAHHKEYYAAKWAAAKENNNVLAFFSPEWLSPWELAFLWFTGWKPATAFRLVETLRKTRAPLTSLAQLTEAQVQRMQELHAKVKAEEEKVEREMERQQAGLGDRKMVELARLASRVNGEEGIGDESVTNQVDGMEGAVKGLLTGLEKVMKMADYVRLMALKGVLDVLSPRQGVDFLAVFAMLHIQMRKWGKKRAANGGTNNGNINGAAIIVASGIINSA